MKTILSKIKMFFCPKCKRKKASFGDMMNKIEEVTPTTPQKPITKNSAGHTGMRRFENGSWK